MRAAPVVSVAIGLSPAWRAAQALLWALAAATLGAWLLARGGQPPGWAGGLVLPAGWLAWRFSAGTAATLSWDGQQWQLNATPVQLTVAMDLGPWLLLSLQAGRRRRRHWLPATAAQAGPHWHALRAALYSRAPEAPLAAAPPASPQGASAPD